MSRPAHPTDAQQNATSSSSSLDGELFSQADLLARLPPPDDDEPAGLRSDIADELSDHLSCAVAREALAGTAHDAIRSRVLARFGSPAAVAARLWWDAQKGRLVMQRLTLGTAAVSVVLSLVAVGAIAALFVQQRTLLGTVSNNAEVLESLAERLPAAPVPSRSGEKNDEANGGTSGSGSAAEIDRLAAELRLRSDYARLLQTLGTQHPQVTALRTEAAALGVDLEAAPNEANAAAAESLRTTTVRLTVSSSPGQNEQTLVRLGEYDKTPPADAPTFESDLSSIDRPVRVEMPLDWEGWWHVQTAGGFRTQLSSNVIAAQPFSQRQLHLNAPNDLILSDPVRIALWWNGPRVPPQLDENEQLRGEIDEELVSLKPAAAEVPEEMTEGSSEEESEPHTTGDERPPMRAVCLICEPLWRAFRMPDEARLQRWALTDWKRRQLADERKPAGEPSPLATPPAVLLRLDREPGGSDDPPVFYTLDADVIPGTRWGTDSDGDIVGVSNRTTTEAALRPVGDAVHLLAGEYLIRVQRFDIPLDADGELVSDATRWNSRSLTQPLPGDEQPLNERMDLHQVLPWVSAPKFWATTRIAFQPGESFKLPPERED